MDVVAYETLVPFTTADGSTIREFIHSPAQSLAEATLEPGQSTMRHYHALSEEIYLLTAGGGTMELDGDVREVGEGDAILIPPGAWHELRAGSEGVKLLCCCVPPYSHDDTYFARYQPARAQPAYLRGEASASPLGFVLATSR